ncbi:MAG: ABC transporter substrate-binding protein [Candidatus Sedimenticola endophacoides]
MSPARSYRIATLLLLLLNAAAPIRAASPPGRVVSTNLCTDQLLLLLADERQIASVTHLAREPNSSFMAEAARGYPVNHDRVEELLALQPDLVVTGGHARTGTAALLDRLGYRVEHFPDAADLEGIRANIRRMASLLGRRARGEVVIGRMQRRIIAATTALPEKPLSALFYQPRGYTSGSGTLHDLALHLSGWRNVATEEGIRGFAPIDLERVLLARPVQLFTSTYAPGTDSLAQRQLRHPALRQLTAARPMIEIGYRYWICSGPMIAEAVERLARARRDR